MGRSAREITIATIKSGPANRFVKRHHYSGKVVANSQVHFGAFLDGRLHGVMSFGPPLDRRKLLGLVEGSQWDSFMELNRMAFDDYLPRNSESYAIGQAMRYFRRNARHLKWIVSFADATACGDGTIYRASNFVLTGIKRNTGMIELPDGTRVSRMTIDPSVSGNGRLPGLGDVTPLEYFGGPYTFRQYCEAVGAKPAEGFMLRYVYFLDPRWRSRLTVPEIPFAEIRKQGATMYLGKRPGDTRNTTEANQ